MLCIKTLFAVIGLIEAMAPVNGVGVRSFRGLSRVSLGGKTTGYL